MRSGILLLALCALASAQTVLVLTEENFETTLAEHPKMLVEVHFRRNFSHFSDSTDIARTFGIFAQVIGNISSTRSPFS